MAVIKGEANSGLILCRTPQDRVEAGVPVIVRGEGCRVFDQAGKSYLDFTSGVTRPVHLGFGNRELAQAAAAQAAEMAYFTPMGFTNPRALELAAALAQVTPAGIDNFFFVCDGSEAVESAMKLAKQSHADRGQPQRFKIISRRGAYHGVTSLALRALGTVLPMRHIMEPMAPGAVFVESPYCYRCPLHLAHPDCELACARDLRRIIEFEGPDTISVFIGEPVQQGFGALSPPEGYWQVIREILDDYSIYLIIDEVICGFGRTGRMFGSEHFKAKPDLITMAKGITSGYVPLGAVGASDQVLEPIEMFEHLHTYANHPVACAAGLKNLEILEREGLVERAAGIGAYFLEALKPLTRHAIVGEVRGVGCWLGLDFTTDKKTRADFPLANLMSLVERARQKGLVIKLMGQAIELAPPLIIEKDEIDQGVAVLDQCIAEEAGAMGLA